MSTLSTSSLLSSALFDKCSIPRAKSRWITSRRGVPARRAGLEPANRRAHDLHRPAWHEQRGGDVNIEFLSTVAVIAPDPSASRELYVGALGLPLEGRGEGYHHSEQI